MNQSSEGPDLLTYVGFGVGAFVLLTACRYYIKGAQFREKVNAKGKVALVTGANSGIGKQVVRELNLRGAKVYMLCRNEERGIEAKRELSIKYGCDSTRLIVCECDLASFESIRKFCKKFEREEESVEVLVNNAGVLFLHNFQLTEDGYETTLQSNYLGHFLLTELLLPKLEKAVSGARIVNVSSRIHVRADTVNLERLNSPSEYRMFKTYARSKLACTLHAVELTRRLRRLDSGTKVTINSCHPGVVGTNLVRIAFYQKYVSRILYPLAWYFLKTDLDGAQTPLFLALSQKVNGVSGRYFSDCAEAPVHPFAFDEDICQELYNQSLEAVSQKEDKPLENSR